MSTGLDIFDTTLEKTNKILHEILLELEWDDRRNQAYLALRTVLHALRDRLMVNDAAHFAAQLPILLKGVFFDGWSPAHVPVKMNREEFLGYIAKNFKLDTEMGTEEMTRTILNIVFESIDPLESEKIINSLPADIAELLT